jgi:hypothetical protein
MSNEPAPDRSDQAFLRELLLKEAEWVRADMESARAAAERLQTVQIGAVYVLLAWVLGRALAGLRAPNEVDALFISARRSPDIAIVVCAIPVVTTAFSILGVETAFRWHALTLRLAEMGRQLSGADIWNWTSQINREAAPLFGVFTSSMLWLALSVSFTIGALWFASPATALSRVALVCWWTAAGASVFQVLLGGAAGALAVWTAYRKNQL